jgi:hypothetical protein
MYDIIGDVHGEATLLEKLLKKAGYHKRGYNYHHPEKKAVFVGDFVNRGPEIRETLRIIRRMMDEGNALAILGNHEINLLLSSMKNEKGDSLLAVTGKRYASVFQTVQQFKSFPEEWKEIRKWLRSLPLFLELDPIRIVHACWKDENIVVIKREIQTGRIPKSIFRHLVSDPKSELSQSILQTTRGIHHILPSDLRIYDNRHRNHPFYRIRWWNSPEGLTFQQWSFESKFKLPNYTIPKEIIPESIIYPEDAPVVFFGHYCRGNGPWVIRDNLCCVDACVTGKGTLAAYRWDGEPVLNPENLIFARSK